MLEAGRRGTFPAFRRVMQGPMGLLAVRNNVYNKSAAAASMHEQQPHQLRADACQKPECKEDSMKTLFLYLQRSFTLPV